MQTIYSFFEPVEAIPTVLTIGVFDGVHLGHERLIRRVVESAHPSDRRAVVVTFFPAPHVVFGGTSYYLTSTDEKLALFKQLGVDLCLVIEFTPEIARLRAIEFVKRLVSQLHMTELWAGPDFALGQAREGDMAFLKQAGAELGFTLNEVEPASDDEIISSSRIRKALSTGDVETARYCLGRPFRLAGTVVKGAGRGHSIGIPTVNLSVWAEKAVPVAGVYACLAYTDQSRYLAVTNIGTRPTFDNGPRTIEAHLLDFDGNLYGRQLSLDFIARLRAEKKFEDISQLIAQIQSDIRQAREILLQPTQFKRPMQDAQYGRAGR